MAEDAKFGSKTYFITRLAKNLLLSLDIAKDIWIGEGIDSDDDKTVKTITSF